MSNIYDDYFFNDEDSTAKKSAQIIMPYVLDRLQPKSIIDFGCGTGQWLAISKEHPSVERVLGIDGAQAESMCVLNRDEFMIENLGDVIDLEERFDLTISLEVAEHIDESRAKIFIGNLTRHSDIVLFSAAIPWQGGRHHVNEQYPSYWREIFNKYGYEVCDCLRKVFWDNEGVDIWYRQNIMFYCKKELVGWLEEKFVSDETMLDVIHPGYWVYFREGTNRRDH